MNIVKILILFLTLFLYNCPTGQSPRDVCIDGNNYSTGAREALEITCYLPFSLNEQLLRSNTGDQNKLQNERILILVHCNRLKRKLKECRKKSNLPTEFFIGV